MRETKLFRGAGRFGAALLLLLLANTAGAQQQAPEIRVTFLGTNGPMPEPGRIGTSTLVEAGGMALVFDAGLNVTQQLVEAGQSLNRIDRVFLTHFHSDHLAGLPGLWSTSWLRRRSTPFYLHGPPGVNSVASGLLAYYAKDIPTRINGPEALPAGGSEMIALVIEQEGEVFSSGDLKVTAFLVDHGIDVGIAFGYRVDYRGLSVVLSGDTTYSENLIEHSQGVDLLVHEVMGVTDEMLQARLYRSGVLEVHATPEQAGRVFAKTRPRLAAFTHIILARRAGFESMQPDELLQRTATEYDGRVFLPEALDQILIRPDSIVTGQSDVLR